MGNSNNHPERPSSAAGILSNTPRLGSGSPSYQETSLCPLCGKYHLSHRMRSGSGSSGRNLPYARGDIPFDSGENVADSETIEDILSRQSNPARDLSDIPSDSGENVADSETLEDILSRQSNPARDLSEDILSRQRNPARDLGVCPRCGKYHPPYRMRGGSGSSVQNLPYARGGGSGSSVQNLPYARGGGSGSSGRNLPYARGDIPSDSGENVADSETIEDILSRQSNQARDLSDLPFDSGENVADSETIEDMMSRQSNPARDWSDKKLDSGENVADYETIVKELDSEEELAVIEQSVLELEFEDELAASEQRGGICQYHLRGKCYRGSNCWDLHCELPYQWRLRRKGSQVWTYFSEEDNDRIERAFCDPNNERHNVYNHEMTIDFNSMSGKDNADCQFEIERLSTPTSVNHGNQSWRTKWLWYWRNPKGEWIKFGDLDKYEGCVAKIESANLEEAFVANPFGRTSFKTNGKYSFVYIVNFLNMTQCNTKHDTIRELRRRPEFINKVDFELNLLRTTRNTDNAVNNGIKAPANWSILKGKDLCEHNELVQLKETDQEYKEIRNLLIVENAVIISIDRIENGDLWEKYMMKKSKMLENKNEEQLGETRVFHGTDGKNAPAICKQGFDARLAGTANGSVKGKGCYFAKDSTKAHDYGSRGTEYSTMFVTKILPGEYVLGNSSYCRPPHKDKSSDLYDSCVDDVKNPKTFVIFDNNQMYPEYVIRYKVMNPLEKFIHFLTKQLQEDCRLTWVGYGDEYTE